MAQDEHPELACRVREALRVRGVAADHVVLVAPGSIPRTTSGKIRRHAVADKLRSRASSSATSAAARPSRP